MELSRSLGANGWLASQWLGTLLSATGPVDRAIAALEDSVAGNPKTGRAHWSRAQLGSKEGAECRVERMRDVLALPDMELSPVRQRIADLAGRLDSLRGYL